MAWRNATWNVEANEALRRDELIHCPGTAIEPVVIDFEPIKACDRSLRGTVDLRPFKEHKSVPMENTHLDTYMYAKMGPLWEGSIGSAASPVPALVSV